MSNTFHIQLELATTRETLFRAWTDELALWFAENSNVSIQEKRYDFWGRFTPEAPAREQGRHPLYEAETNHTLKYGWHILQNDTTVSINLQERDGNTVVMVQQQGIPRSHDISSYTFEDFWFLSLENLRRHVDGKPPVRCDFSKPMLGDIRHTVDIDGSREAVFETLIRPEQLERWIASNATIEPRVDGRYDFGWKGTGPVKILELIPNEKLSYSWTEAETETVVTWSLEGSEGKTRLTLVHSGFAPTQKTGGLNAGWLNFMSWVKSLVEYGPGWKPAVIPLTPEMQPFYAKSIWEGQSSLALEQKSVNLGDYVEILTSVSNLAATEEFYETLGFQKIGDFVFTDGGINIHLSSDNFPSPTLHYAGSDIESVKLLAIPLDTTGAFTDPNRLRVQLSAQPSGVSMPQGDPFRRSPISRCGTFGEFAIPCVDAKAAVAFWQRLGFKQLHLTDEPYPWAIMSDGLIILGLHQTTSFTTPTITYFAGNMADRIEQLQRDGIAMTPLEPPIDGRAVNAVFGSPDGQKFFLFEGQI